MALPRSRVPLVETGPALRPRGCPAYSPSRTQDCCLPGRANRRLPTTLPIAGLNHAACLLAPPGSVRPLTGRHAGALLTGWLSLSQVGLAPYWLAPTGKQQPISWVYTQFQGFGLTLARAHRLCSHITRAYQGVSGHTVDIARPCIASAKTTPGLRVPVRILDKGDQTGRQYTVDFKQNMTIICDDHLP
jgi:hypothetical protein